MPLFQGERPLTPEERASDRFEHNALAHFSAQTGHLPTLTSFSVVPTNVGLFFVARPMQPHLRRADPDVWFIFDEDVDETEGWISQGIFNSEGYIAYDSEGQEPLRSYNPDTGEVVVQSRPRPQVVQGLVPVRYPVTSAKKSAYAHLLEGLADARAAKSEPKPRKTNWERLREK
jgi:hypothetical protein